MLVTQVTELSKSRSKVYIDQEFAFVLYKGELRLYHIKEGEPLKEEDYRTIMGGSTSQTGEASCHESVTGTRIYHIAASDETSAGLLSAQDHRAGN